MATRLLPPGYQEFDADGAIAAGAKLYTYGAGTSTPKATYSDAALTVANANPIVADGSGRFGDIFAGVGSYRLVMTKSDGSTLWTADPVDGASSSTSAGSVASANLLVNGDFGINQRAAASVADDVYCLDAWYGLTSTGNITVAQQTLQADGIPTNIRLTQPDVASKRVGLAQIIEAANCRFLRLSSVTFSATIRHSLAAPIRYALLEWTGSADAVTSDVVNDWNSSSYTAGGFFNAANLTVAAVGSIQPVANTWTDLPPLTATISGSLNNLIVFVWTEGSTAQNATLDIAMAQVVPGTEATDFIYPSRQQEMARCQRYYWTGFHSTTTGAASQTMAQTVTYPVPMISAPTASWAPTFTSYVESFAVNSMTTNGARSVMTATAGGAAEWTGTVTLIAAL